MMLWREIVMLIVENASTDLQAHEFDHRSLTATVLPFIEAFCMVVS